MNLNQKRIAENCFYAIYNEKKFVSWNMFFSIFCASWKEYGNIEIVDFEYSKDYYFTGYGKEFTDKNLDKWFSNYTPNEKNKNMPILL